MCWAVELELATDKAFSKNQMNFDSISDGVVMFFIVATTIAFQSLFVLLSFKPSKIMKDEKEILMSKTKKQLKEMVGDMKGISRMNKLQLVEILLA